MNTIIWIIQGILGLSFIIAGLMALLISKEKLVGKMPWAKDFSAANVKLIGIAKLLGGIGVIVPSLLFNRWSHLTTAAAIGLAVLMLCAVIYHISKKENKEVITPVAYFLMAIFIIYQFVSQ